MNAIPANELKRHGIAAIEKLLVNGPVHVIKRNQPICVVLAEAEYERLTRDALPLTVAEPLSVTEWFALPTIGTASKEELDARLQRERSDWRER